MSLDKYNGWYSHLKIVMMPLADLGKWIFKHIEKRMDK